MSVSSGTATAGAVLGVDPQDALLAALVAFMTKVTPSVQHVLDLAAPHLREAAGLTAASVFELDSETGLLNPTARSGRPGARDQLVAGKVFRLAAGAVPQVKGEHLAVRLRIGGQTVGVLLLTGDRLGVLRSDVVATLALHLATTLQGLAAEKHRQFVSHASATIRRLFEQGMTAASVEAAGRVLAASSAEGFRTEHATVVLVDPDGTVRYVHAVGLREGEATVAEVVGRSAGESPVWEAVKDGTVVLAGNVTTSAVRPCDLARLMRLRSFVAMPLMSAQGPVGMIMCGDSSAPREWTGPDRILAEQLSVEGALIIESAGMRQAAQDHVAALSHQAFHDALTGLPNRTHLVEQTERAVRAAGERRDRVALLVLDLNGFKQVNDTAGHQAGDVLLQQVAKRLRGAVRDNDVVSRLGGDEFAILLTHDANEDVAGTVAGRICERLRRPFEIDGRQTSIGGSVGIALYPDDATGYEALMKGADAAMYEAKRATKGSGGGFRRARAAF